jgi:putative ABC transport system permease protein
MTVLTTVLFGTAPSWLASRADVAPIVKGEARILGGARADSRLPRLLIAAQVAISFVLLCAAAVLVRSFKATQSADLGFTRKPVLTVWMSRGDLPDATAQAAVDRVAAMPGVHAVAVAFRAPLSLSGGGLAQPLFLPHRPPAAGEGLPEVKFNAVSANYFEVMGTRLRRGRPFTQTDERPGGRVLVVNEQFARQFFPGADALDAVVRLGSAAGAEHRIVGVVQDAPIESLSERTVPYFYVPYWRGKYGDMTLLVAGPGDTALLSRAIRAALIELDGRLEPRRLVTMPEYIRYSAGGYQATAALGAALGCVGLLLTVLGVYGVIAFQTGRRTREFGVRLALGADRAQVLGLVLRQGLGVLLTGLAAGVPAALAVTASLSSMLFATQAWDVLSFVSAAGVLLVAVGLATLVPARRALRVSAATALRDA